MILVTGDIHLNSNPRDSYRHTFMADTLPALLRNTAADHLIILGDLTDDKDYHSARLVSQIVGYLDYLSTICPVVLLTGNHDYTDPEHPFFAFVARLPGITWILRPTSSDVMQSKVLFLPHTTTWKRDWQGLKFKGYHYIFAHQTFQGAKVGPRTFEGVPASIFPDEARIISGDVHVPQAFDIIHYVGAPYLCDFGDDYKPRVLLLNGKGGIKSIAVPGVQKRLLEVDSITDLDKRAAYCQGGDILKVRVTLRAADHARWPAIQAQVHEWGARRNFKIYLVQPQIIGQKGKATARRRIDTRTDQQLVEQYGQARTVGPQTLKVGLELI